MSRAEAEARKGFERRLVNLPVSVWAHLDKCAKAQWRTTTAEVRRRLEESMANESIDEHGVIVVHSPTPLK